jgi:hypothetical protein
MSLTEALRQSQRPPLTQQRPQMACGSIPHKGSVAVAYDGQFWDVRYLGCPFAYLDQAEVEQFLGEEGISLQEGWLPHSHPTSA